MKLTKGATVTVEDDGDEYDAVVLAIVRGPMMQVGSKWRRSQEVRVQPKRGGDPVWLPPMLVEPGE